MADTLHTGRAVCPHGADPKKCPVVLEAKAAIAEAHRIANTERPSGENGGLLKTWMPSIITVVTFLLTTAVAYGTLAGEMRTGIVTINGRMDRLERQIDTLLLPQRTEAKR